MGEFEEIILLIVAAMNGNAYGIAIINELEEQTGRSASIGAVQTVLKRMEDKGWVQSAFGEVTQERGGKRKRYYTITLAGHNTLKANHEMRNKLWNALPKFNLSYAQ